MQRALSKGLILLLFVMVCACGQHAEQQQDPGSLLPKRIGAWQQVRLVTGSDALEQINTLHGKNIVVEAGAIGTYEVAGKRPAMIWISRSKTAELTKEQAEIMADKMVSNPHSPFHDPSTLIRNAIKVYTFLGMGQIHYIFCRGRLGYWISAPPQSGEELLLYFLKGASVPRSA